jgi:hypothetical protein
METTEIQTLRKVVTAKETGWEDALRRLVGCANGMAAEASENSNTADLEQTVLLLRWIYESSDDITTRTSDSSSGLLKHYALSRITWWSVQLGQRVYLTSNFDQLRSSLDYLEWLFRHGYKIKNTIDNLTLDVDVKERALERIAWFAVAIRSRRWLQWVIENGGDSVHGKRAAERLKHFNGAGTTTE